MNSDTYEDNPASKYMFSIPIMGIDSDGSVVIDGHRTHTDVTDLSIESAEVLVLPFEGEDEISIDGQDVVEYEEEVIGTYDPNIIISDNDNSLTAPMLMVMEDPDNAELQNLNLLVKNNQDSLMNSHGYNIFDCDICCKTFPTQASLNKHVVSHSSAPRHQCGICEKSFSQQSNLWKHIRAHTGERPFVCGVCNKAFTQLANLQKHDYVHSGLKPFTCPICGKGFSQQANMMKHTVLHTGERPFVCQTCKKGFTQKSNLTKHELLHRGIKPYSCKICYKSFTQQSNLKKHESQHMNLRPFKCPYCHKCYIQKVSLERHMIKCMGPVVYEQDFMNEQNQAIEIISANAMRDPLEMDIRLKQEFIEIADIKEEVIDEHYNQYDLTPS